MFVAVDHQGKPALLLHLIQAPLPSSHWSSTLACRKLLCILPLWLPEAKEDLSAVVDRSGVEAIGKVGRVAGCGETEIGLLQRGTPVCEG
jgi:hypothetical protein